MPAHLPVQAIGHFDLSDGCLLDRFDECLASLQILGFLGPKVSEMVKWSLHMRICKAMSNSAFIYLGTAHLLRPILGRHLRKFSHLGPEVSEIAKVGLHVDSCKPKAISTYALHSLR